MSNNYDASSFNKNIIFYLLLIFTNSYSQNRDTIKLISDKDKNHFLLLNNQKILVADSLGIIKGRLMKHLIAFPELKKYVKKNLKLFNNFEDLFYLKNVINCYNQAITESFKIANTKDYFHKFNLYTKKEIKKGPTDEMIKNKEYITFKTLLIEFTNSRYDPMTLRQRTGYGKISRSHFRYGNSPYYSTGFVLSNLKRALKDDKEALKYITKYRNKYYSRTALYLLGGALGVLTVISIEKGPDELIPVFAIPCVLIFASRPLFPPKYKAKYIEKAVEVYNMNFQSEKYKKEDLK